VRNIKVSLFIVVALAAVAVATPISAWAKSVKDKPVVAKTVSPDARFAQQQKVLADAAFTQKRWNDAAQHYIRAMELAGNTFSANDRLQITKRLIDIGQVNKAIEFLHALLRDQPNNIAARVELAKALLGQHNYADAVTHAEHALQLDPRNHDAESTRATAQKALNRLTAARKTIAAGDSYFAKQQYEQAAQAYFEALMVTDSGISATATRGLAERVVSHIKAEDAMALARQAAQAQASDDEANSAQAKLYFALAEAAVALAAGDNNKTVHNGKSGARGYNKSQIAKLYVEALSLAPNNFTADERLRVATWLTHANKFDAAFDVIDALVADEPDNIKARLARIKAYTNAEQYDAAISDADQILDSDPSNAGALLARASALQKQKKLSAAIAQYQEILDQDDNFDARLGLSYSLLAAGKKRAASQTLEATQTDDESQLEDLAGAKYALAKSTRPTIDVTQSQYKDSDDNTSREFGFGVKGSLYDFDLAGLFRSKNATGVDKHFNVNSYAASVATNLATSVKFFGKLGWTQIVDEPVSPVGIGQMKLDAQTSLARMVLDLSRDNLTSTVDIIDKGIQVNQAAVTLSRPLPNRFTVKGTYTRKAFSDANTANDVQAALQYRLGRGAPPISIGYGYHYMNYDHPTHDSYFDPQNYSAHQLLLALSWEQLPYYVSIDTILGHQEFQHNNDPQMQSWFSYVTATVGIELVHHLTLEFNGEWGNSIAIATPGVYDSSVLGLRIAYMF